MKSTFKYKYMGWFLSVLFSGILWSCNVSDPGKLTVLDLTVPDSLSTDQGQYTAIRVDIYDGQNNLIYPGIYNGPYNKKTDSATLANLALGNSAPNPMVIEITGLKGDKETVKITINVKDKIASVPLATLVDKRVTPLPPVGGGGQPQTISILTDNPLSLSTSGPAIELLASTSPLGTGPIVWASADSSIADITIDNKVVGLKVGTTTLTATSLAEPTLSATLTVYVQADIIVPTAVTIVTPSPLVLILGGSSTKLKAGIVPAGARQEIIWTSVNPAMVAIENTDFAAPVAVGETKVIATSKVNPALLDTLVIRVQAPVIVPKSITLLVSDTLRLAIASTEGKLSAQVEPTGSKQDLIWSIADPTIAQITATNTVKALKPGVTEITATVKEAPTITKSLVVEVIQPVKVNGITMTPSTLVLYPGGEAAKVIVTLIGNDAGAKYTISSSEPTIAWVGKGDSVKGLKAGKAILSASPVGYPALIASCEVEVKTDPPVVTITDPKNGAIIQAMTYKVLYTAKDPATGTTSDLNKTFTLVEGANSVEVTSTNAGGDGKASVTINVDSKVPIVGFTTGDNQIVGDATFTLAGTADDGTGSGVAKVVVTSAQASVPAGDIIPSNNGDWTKVGITLASGKNTLDVVAIDKAGNVSVKKTRIVNLDKIGPKDPTFTEWPQNPTNNTKPIWKWSLDAEVVKYVAKFDNQSITDITGTQYTPSTGLSEGTHTLTITAVDAYGNLSKAVLKEISVELQEPNFAINDNGKWVTSSSYTISGTVSDPGSGIQSVTITKPTGIDAIVTGETWKANSTINLSEGNNDITANAKDSAGNTSADMTVTVKLDSKKPTITVTEYGNGSINILSKTTKVSLSGSIVDGSLGSGIKSASYILSGKTISLATSISKPEAFQITSLNLSVGGITTITITATDMSNNVQVYIIDFNVTLKPPVVQILSPKNNFITNSIGEIAVRYTVDGVEYPIKYFSLVEPNNTTSSTTQIISVEESNEAGKGSDSRTVSRVNRKVVFFKPNTPSTATCTSWDDACLFKGILTGYAGKTIWLAEGDYDLGGEELSLYNVKVYGGISDGSTSTTASGSKYSHLIGAEINGRGNTAIRLDGPTLEINRISISGVFASAALQSPGNEGIPYFNDCKFYELRAVTSYYGLAIYTLNTVVFNRCIFDNTGGKSSMISFWGADGKFATFNSCTFTTALADVGGLPYYDIESYYDPPNKNTLRFSSTTGSPYLRTPEQACGLSGLPGCDF